MNESFEVKEAGLPNIKGTIFIHYSAPLGEQGAFYHFAGDVLYNSSATDYRGWNGLGFDASRSSSIYKDDCTTVQPPAFTVMYIIKVK